MKYITFLTAHAPTYFFFVAFVVYSLPVIYSNFAWKKSFFEEMVRGREGREGLSPAPECLQPCAVFNSSRWFEKEMTNKNKRVRYPHIYSSYSSQFQKLIGRESEKCNSISQTSMQQIQQSTARKMKFPIKDFFSKCDQIRRKQRIWSHLLKKSLMENFILLCSNRKKKQENFCCSFENCVAVAAKVVNSGGWQEKKVE